MAALQVAHKQPLGIPSKAAVPGLTSDFSSQKCRSSKLQDQRFRSLSLNSNCIHQNPRARTLPFVILAGNTEEVTEEDLVSLKMKNQNKPQKSQSNVSLPPVRPLPSPPTSTNKKSSSSSSIDIIEIQAKSSIDRLKNLLYKLRTRPQEATETTFIPASPPPSMVDLPASLTLSSTVEEQREVYVSQSIQVDMGDGETTAKEELAAQAEYERATEADLEDESEETKEAEQTLISGKEKDLFNDLQQQEAAVAPCLPSSSPSLPSSSSSSTTSSPSSSLTCTRTIVQFDELTGSATVTVSATVRETDILSTAITPNKSKQIYSQKLLSMAARALSRTCRALEGKEKFPGEVGSGAPLAEVVDQGGHDKLLCQLATGSLTWQGQGETTAFREAYLVQVGTVGEAWLRVGSAGDRFGRWEEAQGDWVAYQVSSLLGFDMVPPAVIRRDVQLGDNFFEKAVLVYKVNDVRPLSSMLPEQWGAPCALTAVSNAHILDALLGNAPRRKELFKAGSHWTESGQIRPVLLDHPMGQASGEMHAMWNRFGNSTKGLTHVAPTTLARLRGLTRGILLAALGSELTLMEVEMILQRKNKVVSYFDSIASWQQLC